MDGKTPVSRRDVLRSAAGLAATAASPVSLTVLTQAATAPQSAPARLIPADKGIAPDEIERLRLRGAQRVYRSAARATIGMPCGGIGAGQVYVRGDGTLAGWQVDGRHYSSGWGAENYRTYRPESSISQGFAIAVTDGAGATTRATLDDAGFDEIEFAGEYPVAKIRYRATSARPAAPPVDVDLEAFSPFTPGDARNSAWPAVVLRFTVTNRTAAPLRATIGGWLQNAVLSELDSAISVQRRNAGRPDFEAGTLLFLDAVHEPPPLPAGKPQTRMLFDFESGTYDGWTIEGDAFGDAPAAGTLPTQNPVSGFAGKRLVNSYASDDDKRGRMLSGAFTLDMPFLTFRIGGGAHAGKTCLNLLVDGKTLRTAAGRNNERLEPRVWDVRSLAGREARLEILDAQAGPWGHVNVDEIALSDALPAGYGEFDRAAPGFGSLALAALGPGEAWPRIDSVEAFVKQLSPSEPHAGPMFMLGKPQRDLPDALGLRGGFEQPLIGAVARTIEIPAQQSGIVDFVVAWHFPNLHTGGGRMYANWFEDAADVARQLAPRLDDLRRRTRDFADAYYRETTLPWWLAERLMMPISTLATGTCQWWKSGRFWAWEGVGCCEGTCTHVWNYAQGEAFLFPELARATRTHQDLGAGFDPASGLVGFRSDRNYAADGQAGAVLKCYREHRNSADDGFLREYWPRIRMALEYLIRQDEAAGEADGVIENSQHNTYDINFEGPNTFVGALYLAALRAGEEMARLMNEPRVADRYHALFQRGRDWIAANLFNGEYFEQRIPPGAKDRFQYGAGCLSDQLFGQNWARLLGLGPILPPKQVAAALHSVYRYNWAPDVGPLNTRHAPERWFARPGEGGLFVCTWPRGGRPGEPVRYRDEVWTGIEYQVAAGMIWEASPGNGAMLDAALVMLRALDVRYDGTRHNPWNEVECGDHYARALASWGAYCALLGFEYDGPAGLLRIEPRVDPDDFAAVITFAQGWGIVRQRRAAPAGSPFFQTCEIDVRGGMVSLREIGLTTPETVVFTPVECMHRPADKNAAPQKLAATLGGELNSATVRLNEAVTLREGERLEIRLEATI